MATSYLAFDLGASSGRAILGTLSDGAVELEELHRFETVVVEKDGHLYWDIDTIWASLEEGLEKAATVAENLRSLSVDSWAVDYVPLDDNMKPVRLPYCYRDTRTAEWIDEVHRIASFEECYRITGIQQLPFNSIYQIYTDLKTESDLVAKTATRLMIADYFNFKFSGRPVIELSNASTTQLVDARTHNWSETLLDRLGMDASRFPEIVGSGTKCAGTDASRGIPVICGLSHDTACAVAAVPADESAPWIYLSSGTWSLMGAELGDAILTKEACRESYTNEVGLDRSIRFLKNMTGMWALEECIRVWRDGGDGIDYTTLMEEAASADKPQGVIDLDEPQFGERGDMQGRILAACDAAGLPKPETRAQLVRLILESLAHAYRGKLKVLSRLSGTPESAVLHIVGGGSRNHLLNQLTADACNRHVVAGPAESSALGNVLVQARSMGDIPAGLSVRQIARNSSRLTEFTPKTTGTSS